MSYREHMAGDCGIWCQVCVDECPGCGQWRHECACPTLPLDDDTEEES